MSGFLTVEDINTVIYNNQDFYWYEIDTSKISEDEDFSNVKYDFVEVSRETGSYTAEEFKYKYTFNVNASNWTMGYYGLAFGSATSSGIIGYSNNPSVSLWLYCGPLKYSEPYHNSDYLKDDVLDLNYAELNVPQTIYYYSRNGSSYSTSVSLVEGYNDIVSGSFSVGYLLVNLVKTDFQFNCTDTVHIGKINTVQLGTTSDYKPSGALIGDNTPTITVDYKGETLPVTWNSELNDYTFELDLTDETTPSKITFTVNIESNKVINQTSTKTSINSEYQIITTQAELKTACRTGSEHIIKLGNQLAITGTEIYVNHDIKIIGGGYQLNLNTHRFIVSEDTTLILENFIFRNGKNSILQGVGSSVEIRNCQFINCIGTGSIVKCDIDINSLENPSDFKTILDNVTITNSDCCIIHGGELTVSNCNVTGKISNKDYPYFLYQTDGSATLTRNTFSITNNEAYDYDLEFNSCIFLCGENAQINGLNNQDLKNNNIQTILQNNHSTINLTYYYEPIEALITLQSDNGYCHSISGIDYVFKTNIQPRRSE